MARDKARKVKIFKETYSCDLERKINEFAETHKIIQVDYHFETDEYAVCMVLYEEYEDIFVNV